MDTASTADDGTASGRDRPEGADRGGLVRSALRRRWRPLTAGTLLATTHQASEAMVPVVIGVVIDRGVRTGDANAMALWVAVLVGLFVVLATAGLFGYYLLERAGLLITHDVRLVVVDRVLDPRGGVAGRPGEVMSLASADADSVGEVSFAVGLTVAALPAMVAAAVILLSSSTQLGLVVLIGVPIVVALVGVLARPLMRRAEEEQEAVAGAAGVITDLVHGLRVLKGVGAETVAAERYRRSSRAALAARLRSARFLGGYEAATFAVSGAFLVVVAWVGGRLAVAGDITIGQLVAAVGLAQFLVDPLSMLIEAAAQGARVRASAGRIRSFIAQPFTVDDAVGPAPAERVGAPVVEVDGVTVDGWGPLSFSVAPAEMVGVVADPSMASALVDLLGRTRDPDGGEIKLHGVPIRSVPLVELRRRVVATRHDAALFSGTIREQLDVPISGSVTSPDVEALLASTAAADVVRTVPGGLDAVVGTAGRSLSGGQRQRLVLARSLATGAEVIVLHDPTTAVDASTEAAIAHGVRRVRAEATTIIITTSPALLAVCDRVLVVVDGAVQAVGNHADLLADERYAALVLG